MGGKGGGGGGGGGGVVIPGLTTSGGSQEIAQWMQPLTQGAGESIYNNYKQAVGGAQQMTGQAPGLYNSAANMNQMGAGLQNAAANKANQASTYDLNTFNNQFFNPYTQQVAQNAAELAQRNFNQMQAPSLMGQFGQTGQFNSGRADQAMQQAQRDQAFNVQQQQANLLNTGYNQAQQNYLNSMGIGVQGAGVMSGAGAGLTNAANTGFNAAIQGIQMPTTLGGQVSSSLGGLPMDRTYFNEQRQQELQQFA